jgi:CBS-domain-containing membrane protein
VPDLSAYVSGGGPWALVALAVISVLRGWLIPAPTVKLLERRAEDLEKALERREKTLEVQGQQLDKLLDAMQTLERAVLAGQPKAPAA